MNNYFIYKTTLIDPLKLVFNRSIFLQVVCSYHVGVCYHCFDNVLCILNLHTAAQFRILQYRLTNMCNTNNCAEFYEVSEKSSYSIDRYGKLRTYIQQHQALTDFCKKLEDVFNLIVLGQVSLFSLLICLDGYLILMVSIVSVFRFPTLGRIILSYSIFHFYKRMISLVLYL